ncbi:hypothetical protein AVEN_118768-1 [Araneus ventricosus]|uniref:Uncharacterized protein n=1 Tax=Araneus ventricosus TaxID=182803 RepID=A0A4Y2BVV8_ARAVE|nr:hypothetical protein AVEN_118768-1 [Araneus ventricosus]
MCSFTCSVWAKRKLLLVVGKKEERAESIFSVLYGCCCFHFSEDIICGLITHVSHYCPVTLYRFARGDTLFINHRLGREKTSRAEENCRVRTRLMVLAGHNAGWRLLRSLSSCCMSQRVY